MHLRRTFIDDLEGPTLGKIKQIMMVVLRHAEKYGHIPIGATELGKADRRRHHAEHVEHNPGCFSWPLVVLLEALHQRGTAAATAAMVASDSQSRVAGSSHHAAATA